jgi:exodeoxyribonuclease V alpha subunit
MRSNLEPSNQEVLSGLVERVTFHNAESGFCVLRAKARGHRDLVTVVGHAAVISAGEWITASGEWIDDRAHGQQFKARFLKTSAPSSIDGIEKYLGSGMIRGVGPVYAKKMVKAFGEKVFDVIEAEPGRLREVTASARFGRNASRTPGPSRRLSGRSWSSFTATGSAPPGQFASSRPTARTPCKS